MSTRQWIDAFEGWDKSIDSPRAADRRNAGVGRLRIALADGPVAPRAAYPRTAILTIAATLLLVAITGAIWWSLRPAPAVAHTMMVRLSGFQRLSPDLPPTMPEMIGDEIIAAFGDEDNT